MKRIVSLVIGLLTVTQGAFALNSNRADVRSADGASERLTVIERIKLKSKVILAEMLRADLLLTQIPLDLVGLEHKHSASTVILGASEAVAWLAAGVTVDKIIDRTYLSEADRRLSEHLADARSHRRWIETLKREIKHLQSKSRPNGNFQTEIAHLGEFLAQRDVLRAQAVAAAKEARAVAPNLRRLGVATRVTLGVLVVPLFTIQSALNSIYAVVLPEVGDQVIKSLNTYIDQANATLAKQD